MATANEMQELRDKLERLIDRHGLHTVVAELSMVCSDKECHVRENWQDEGLAQQWNRAGKALGKVNTCGL